MDKENESSSSEGVCEKCSETLDKLEVLQCLVNDLVEAKTVEKRQQAASFLFDFSHDWRNEIETSQNSSSTNDVSMQNPPNVGSFWSRFFGRAGKKIESEKAATESDDDVSSSSRESASSVSMANSTSVVVSSKSESPNLDGLGDDKEPISLKLMDKSRSSIVSKSINALGRAIDQIYDSYRLETVVNGIDQEPNLDTVRSVNVSSYEEESVSLVMSSNDESSSMQQLDDESQSVVATV